MSITNTFASLPVLHGPSPHLIPSPPFHRYLLRLRPPADDPPSSLLEPVHPLLHTPPIHHRPRLQDLEALAEGAPLVFQVLDAWPPRHDAADGADGGRCLGGGRRGGGGTARPGQGAPDSGAEVGEGCGEGEEGRGVNC